MHFIERFQYYPNYGKPPDDPKERPSPWATKHTQREWGVGASDEEIDRGVFDNLKHTFGLASWQGVIERRRKIKQHHRCREEARTDDECRICVLHCMHNKKWSCHQCHDQSDTVADTVRDLFPYGLLTLGYCKQYFHDLYDLLSIPFIKDAVKYVAARIRGVQDILERRITMENASFYLCAPIAEMGKIEFIQAVLTGTDCDLHLDINNVYVNSVNHGCGPLDFIRAMPAEHVIYMQMAEHYNQASNLIIDTAWRGCYRSGLGIVG